MAFPPSLSYVASLVRAHDYDRYLCTLFAPAAVREAWFALFAFNHEVAAIPDMVSEEMIGFMRYAWWREALDEIYAAKPVRKHPVAEALAAAVAAHRLPRAPLDALLDAREAKFAGNVQTDEEAYFRATSSTLFTLCADALGVAAASAEDALGVAWAAVGTARVEPAGDKAAALWCLGEEKLMLSRAKLPDAFLAFRDAVEFYLRRHKAGKRTDGQLLPLSLCWRRLRRTIKL